MPAPARSTTKLAPATSRPQPYIMIPGTKRPVSRRVAANHATGIRAMVVPDKASNSGTLLKVSLMREQRVLYHTLKGHNAPIVDVEFLKTGSVIPVHVLGSCDRDGVVFLWFLYVAVDKLGIDVSLDLLKKYSFFTLRRSTTAFYSRIRLAGTIDDGTMVLVPNDGANVRVISFQCQPIQPDGNDNNTPLITATADDDPDGEGDNGDHPQIEPGPDHQSQQPPALPRSSSGYDPYEQQQYQQGDTHEHHQQQHHGTEDLPFSSMQRTAVGLDDLAARSAAHAAMTFESSGHAAQDEQGVSSRSTMNSSVVQARADVEAGRDDLPTAVGVGEGVQMEGALTPLDSMATHTIDMPPGTVRDVIEDGDDDEDVVVDDEVVDDDGDDVDPIAKISDQFVDPDHQQEEYQQDGYQEYLPYPDNPNHQNIESVEYDGMAPGQTPEAPIEYPHHPEQPMGLTDALIVEGEGLAGFSRA